MYIHPGVHCWTYGSSVLVIWIVSVVFSVAVVPVYIPTNSVKGSSSLHLYQHLLFEVCLLMAFWHVWGAVSLFQCVFLWWFVILNISSCMCWPSVCLLWKNVCSGLWPTDNWFFWSFNIEFCELFIYFGYQPLSNCIIFKCFLQFSR